MYRVIAILILACGLLGAGYYWGSGQVVVEKGETVTVVRDRIVTRIVEVKPDGTTTTTESTEEHHQDTSHTEVHEGPSTSSKVQANYRLGLSYWAGSPADVLELRRGYDGLSLSASRRIIGPIWIDGQVRPFGDRKEVALGLFVQF